MMSPHRDNGGRGERDAGQRDFELDGGVEALKLYNAILQ